MGSLGGAVGFSALLSKLEAAAEGAASPPRFLLMFWPCGTIPYLFLPQGSGRTYTTSPILQPFETAGLREDMIVLHGLRDMSRVINGGGSEGGVVLRTTCADSPGTRFNGGEADDSVAGGPSIDQILLARAPALVTAHKDSVNAICDSRVDSFETSSQCLSYSYATRTVPAAYPMGTTVTEHVPILPELSPAKLYASLFSSFMPGGSERELELRKALQLRKSVLDYALGELKRLNGVAPASEREKIEAHADAIRTLERQLSVKIAQGTPSCQVPPAPDAAIVGKSGEQNSQYGNPLTDTADDESLAQLGRLHFSVIRAAFQCDITRVATFQWAPSTNHVAFKGLYPNEPDTAYAHHPLSHRGTGRNVNEPPTDSKTRDTFEFLANVQTWFNARTAEALVELKAARDIFGGSLLDHTIAPFVTDTADLSHARSPLPAMLFGGRALGLKGGQFVNYAGSMRPFADVWLTVAQAYMRGVDVKTALAQEIFMLQRGSSYQVLPDLWEEPA